MSLFKRLPTRQHEVIKTFVKLKGARSWQNSASLELSCTASNISRCFTRALTSLAGQAVNSMSLNQKFDLCHHYMEYFEGTKSKYDLSGLWVSQFSFGTSLKKTQTDFVYLSQTSIGKDGEREIRGIKLLNYLKPDNFDFEMLINLKRGKELKGKWVSKTDIYEGFFIGELDKHAIQIKAQHTSHNNESKVITQDWKLIKVEPKKHEFSNKWQELLENTKVSQKLNSMLIELHHECFDLFEKYFEDNFKREKSKPLFVEWA